MFMILRSIFRTLSKADSFQRATGGRCPIFLPDFSLFFLMIFSAFTLLCLTAQMAAADYFNLIPYVELREEFNDNIFFSFEDSVDDFITTISPGLDIVEKTERLDASLKGRLDGIIYADNNEFNAVDQHFLGHLGYKITERLGMLADAWYIKDSRPDRDILETGLVQSAEPRKRRNLALGTDYRTSENTSNSLIYQYEASDYEDREFSDSKIHTLNFSHTWNARRFFKETIGRLNLGYVNADFETSEVASFSGTIGASWNYTELLSVLFDIGIRYAETDFIVLEFVPPNQIVTRLETTRQFSGVGSASLEFKGEYTKGNIKLLHDIREARGRGGTTVRTEATGWLRRRFSEKFSVTLSAGYYKNKSDQGTVALVDLNEQTFRIRPGLRYDFNDDIFLEAAYKLTYVKDNVADTSANQNMIFGQIYWQWPIFD
jgi:hypothetical protein